MKIIKCEDYAAVSQKASEIVINQIKTKANSVLGLATGSTPLKLYDNLVKAYQNKEISFKYILSYNLDEYIGIDRNHSQSYYQYMHQHLFSLVDMDEKNVHIPNNDVNRIDEIAELYNIDLNKHQIDLQILGIGSNGHIGFNEPGTPLGNETFIVELDEQTRKDNMRFFNSLEEVPKYAITMGIKNIMKSKKIILMASGIEKADAVYHMIHGRVTDELPASVLQLHPDVVVIVDKLAASKL
ncbi:glucosamine-6-phosphate deaminase [Mariniplasma anaerobium]|uniref:Glucosamine-6-phosphate deaminase n=1 Tax=Mariniplasma anaerobium TaxID=2735436 RepID=A0A7U9TIM7_9MOLU|nr:glucosamine-6-phosphate deaminase [Mariniplasma anaerobium]BCR36814.1 glucosamine-6-phosphate deaminase [Mariniplasma anaerobium]